VNDERETVRFGFGKSWERFLTVLGDERIVQAERSGSAATFSPPANNHVNAARDMRPSKDGGQWQNRRVGSGRGTAQRSRRGARSSESRRGLRTRR
jgi:hypothetical protein